MFAFTRLSSRQLLQFLEPADNQGNVELTADGCFCFVPNGAEQTDLRAVISLCDCRKLKTFEETLQQHSLAGHSDLPLGLQKPQEGQALHNMVRMAK